MQLVIRSSSSSSPETDDVDRDRRLALLQRGGDRAGIGVAGLETVGDQDDRVGDRVRGGREVGRRALEREPDRRPPDRRVVGDLLAQGLLVDALDRHRQVGRLTALGPARLGVVAFVSEHPEADVDLRPIGRDGVDHLVEHALGGIDPRLTGVGRCRHRSGRVHHQLDVDLRARFRLGEGLAAAPGSRRLARAERRATPRESSSG